MSDESEPPALSLRPRKKPEDENSKGGEDAGAEKTAPKLSLKPKSAGAQPAADSAEEKPRLSLKPKAKPAEPAAAPAEAAPTEAPAKPRAKPKLSIKPEEEVAQEEPAETPAPKTPAAEQPAKPRLKPKLGVQTEAAPTATPVEEPPAPSSAPAADAANHRDETNPSIDPAVQEALKKAKAEKPKLKLSVPKPSDAQPEATAPEAASAESAPSLPQQSSGFVGDASPSAPTEPPADPTLPPPIPVVTDSDGQPATTPPLPPPTQLADADEDDDSEAPARKRLRPEQRPIFKIAVFAVVILLLGGMGFGGYMVYNMFFASPELNPYAAPLEAINETPPAEAPAEGPASVAGQLIEQAQDAVAAHDEMVDATDEAAEVPADTSAEAAPPQVVIDIPDEPVTPSTVEPSAAFRDWVSNVVISGVAETSNPRAFINGVLVKRGDTVDHGLTIVFDGIDGDKNLVIFKDASGAVVGKAY